jgi:predicted small lipoprotein YifL
MKKIIALLACLAMLLSMVACGNETPEVTDPTTTAPTTESTEPNNEIVETPDEPATTDGTVGQTLLAAFKANSTGTAEEIANAVVFNPIIQFMPMAMPLDPVEQKLLNGFGETEITGYEEGAMFGPMIGTIPFIGYIFKLADGADVEAFKTLLKDNANLRWNICTAAEELVVENEGNTVFFLMCPASFEQPEVEGDEFAGDELIGDELPIDEMPAAEGEGFLG